MLFTILFFLLGCSDSLLSKTIVEDHYIYPSYYSVHVETDTAIVYEEVVVYDTAYVEVEVEVEVPIDYPIWVDSFVQPSVAAGVDIIWVIDPSGSMNDDHARIVSGITAMMSALPLTGWRLGIIPTDYIYANTLQLFPILPGDAAADAELQMASNVSGAREAGFDAVCSYMTTNPYSGNWLRDDAALLVVFVSDEDDQSTTLSTVSSFTSWLSSVRTSVFVASIVHFDPVTSACNPSALYEGDRYIDATNHFGGQVIDICSADWSTGVQDASVSVNPYTSWDLTYEPVDYNDIYVFVNGALFYNWHYAPAENRIYFDSIPDEQAYVEIAYYYDDQDTGN
jgi:hypothetical protein